MPTHANARATDPGAAAVSSKRDDAAINTASAPDRQSSPPEARHGAAIKVISIRRLDGKSTVKAFVVFQLGGLKVSGAKIVQQPDQAAWVAMPSVKGEGSRGWLTPVEITSRPLRERITAALLEAWERTSSPVRGQATWDRAREVLPGPALGTRADQERHIKNLAEQFDRRGEDTIDDL